MNSLNTVLVDKDKVTKVNKRPPLRNFRDVSPSLCEIVDSL